MDFQKYINNIEENTFIELCEYIGNSNLKLIQELLDNDESLGIKVFQFYVNKFIDEKVNNLSTLIQ